MSAASGFRVEVAVRNWLPLAGGVAYLVALALVVVRFDRPGALDCLAALMAVGICIPLGRKHPSKERLALILLFPAAAAVALAGVLVTLR